LDGASITAKLLTSVIADLAPYRIIGNGHSSRSSVLANLAARGALCYGFARGRTVEVVTMCDYSLHSVATRPAKVGDKLVTTQFVNCLTRGFSEMGETNVAVCLLPGTEIAFENEIEFEGGYGIFRHWKREKKPGGTLARFRQVDVGKPHVHHDALEFPDGKIVLLTRLIEGQRATVLQLPASPQRKAQDHSLGSLSPDQIVRSGA
jgi:hypothetical protein